MADNASFLENSILIAAHPDDELLWFGSILKDVNEVLLVFEDYWPDPKIGPARANALAQFPRPNVGSLKIPEAAVYGLADWGNPVLDDFGLAFGANVVARDAKQSALRLLGKSAAPEEGIRAAYENNAAAMEQAFRSKLKRGQNVFTHNPWGEYGHEDHVQVFRVLDQLRDEIGFTLWMSNYVTERSLPLALRYFGHKPDRVIQRSVDAEFAEQVADVYRQTNTWTWAHDWRWFETEHFMEAPRGIKPATSQGSLMPLNFFNIDPIA
ncbi:MAG: hypothetical protein AAFO68_10990 [Pseudomonadota bacterium]